MYGLYCIMNSILSTVWFYSYLVRIRILQLFAENIYLFWELYLNVTTNENTLWYMLLIFWEII